MNIIVLGLGAMGTATAMHLARRISRRAYFTGFASLDGATIKLTLHAPGARSSPRDVSRLLSDEDARKPEAFVERWLKGVEPRCPRQDVHVHDDSGRALHRRSPSVARERSLRSGLLRSWLQVRARGRRVPGGALARRQSRHPIEFLRKH